MLETLPVMLLIGTALGFLSGLGVGGGSLLMLWLTVVLGVEHSVARSINLMFFLPSAFIACLFRWRQGVLRPGKVLPAVIAGCAFAGVFAWLSTVVEVEVLKKLFGVLLLLTGVRELFYK